MKPTPPKGWRLGKAGETKGEVAFWDAPDGNRYLIRRIKTKKKVK